MTLKTGEYYGLTEEQFRALGKYAGFRNFADRFSLLRTDGGNYYVYSGEPYEFFEFAEDNEIGERYNLTYFTYIYPRNFVTGF